MKIRNGLLVVMLAISGCASAGRMAQYGWDTADARHKFGGRTFSIYVHPSEDVLLVQGSVADSAAVVAPTAIRLVAEDFLKPVPCTVLEPHLIATASYEMKFVCQGVDLRRLILSQRATLTQGATMVPQ